MELTILYEDNHLLVISKPAGVATMGTPAGQPSVLTFAKQYIKEKYGKPGNVYLGIVSRLDVPVTGVLLLARTSKSAARLTDQFRKGEVKKRYWCVVEGHVEPPASQCEDWLRRDARHRRVHRAAKTQPGAQLARLRYRTLKRLSSGTLLEVELETGRKHQIRVQLSSRGWPVWGDRKYGGRQPFSKGIALHCRSLELVHPVRKSPLQLTAPLPSSWKPLGIQ